jgi:hypothetical protein
MRMKENFPLFYHTLQRDSFSIIAVMGKKLCVSVVMVESWDLGVTNSQLGKTCLSICT